MKLNNFKIKPIVEYILITIIFVVISILFASKTGLLASGYHFIDDHEIIEFNYLINKNGFFTTLVKSISDDLSWRFRPFYIVIRVIRTLLFGANFFYWHLCLAIECGLYVSLSYILARKMNLPILASFIFSFIYLIGSQDEMIWRLGPQESLGLLLLVSSFILIFNYYQKKTSLYGFLSIVFIICTTLTKESFLLLVPSMLLFMLYLFIKNEGKDKLINSIVSFIKKNKIMITLIILSLLICLFVIIFYIGLFKTGYAGVDTSYSLGEYIRIMLNVFIRDLKEYLWIILLVILLAGAILIKTINNKNNLQQLIVLILFFVYSLGIEIFLYAKSAMFDRYKIPFIWFLFLAVLLAINKLSNKVITDVIFIVLLISITFIYNQNGQNVVQDSEYYAISGKETTKMLEYIGEINKSKIMNVLTNFSEYELNLSSSMYLQIQENVSSIYYLDDSEENDEYYKLYNEDGSKISMKEANIILTDNVRIDNYNEDDYNVKQFFNYYVLEKKD